MANMRPMLAAKFDEQYNIRPELEALTYPLLASPKIDGIRFMRPPNDGARSRSWTLLPNRGLQEMVQPPLFACLDGEVIVGEDPAAPGLFNRTQSAVMTADKHVLLSIYVFDHFCHQSAGFEVRTATARAAVQLLQAEGIQNVHYLEHTFLHNPDEVLAYEEAALEEGYEGIMLRNPRAPYKYGRSTKREQGLIKVKRYIDEEAEIIGFEALERNTNEPTKNSFGLQTRSSHKAGKIPDNLLGKLLVRNRKWGEFAIGSGFDVATREAIWQNQTLYLGKTVTYKYQPHGTKEKPRTPIFKGFRPEVS